MKRWRRWVIWGGIGALFLIALTILFIPEPRPVDLATVERGHLMVTVEEEGQTRVREVYTISAPITGRVRRIELDVGDPVIAEETIVARIEPVDPAFLDARTRAQAEADVRAAEAAKIQAEADVARAQAELDFARTQLERMRRLHERGTVSQERLDDALRTYRIREAAFNQAEAELTRRVSELERARLQLVTPERARTGLGPCGCIEVKAPVTGRVLQIFNESARVVTSGERLIEIGNPRDLEIVVDLLSSDAVRVEAGQRVIIEQWGGEGALSGRVTRVEPYARTKVSALGIEEQRADVVIEITDPPEQWRRLGHRYRVEVRIVLWEREDALQVPLGALFRDGERWAVFVDDGGTARLRHVAVGRRGGLAAEITDGLEEGERVILHPSDQIEDGISIEERDGTER